MQTVDFFSRMIRMNELGPNMPPIKECRIEPMWFCSSCQKDYLNSRGAEECCHTYKSNLEYICFGCDTTHESEISAKNCCSKAFAPPICPICLERGDSHEDAVECCLPISLGANIFERQKILSSIKDGKLWSEAIEATLSAYQI